MKFEVALPITFQRFIYPQVGLALRYRSFVVGVDNAIPLVIRTNTNGFGIYFSLAFSVFRNPDCNRVAPRVADCSHFGSGKNKIKRKKRR